MLDDSYDQWDRREKWQKNDGMKALEESDRVSLMLRAVRMVRRTEDVRCCVCDDRGYRYHEKADINDNCQGLAKATSGFVVEVEPQSRSFSACPVAFRLWVELTGYSTMSIRLPPGRN